MLIFPLVIGGNGLHSTDDTHKIKLIWVFGLMRNLWAVFDLGTCCGEVGCEFFMLSQKRELHLRIAYAHVLNDICTGICTV